MVSALVGLPGYIPCVERKVTQGWNIYGLTDCGKWPGRLDRGCRAYECT